MLSYSRQQLLAEIAAGKSGRGSARGDGEHENQAAFFDLLRVNEGKYPFLKWIYAVPNAALRGKRERSRILAEGLKAGVSDVCVPIPRKGFHGAYMEFKFGKNTVQANQKEFMEFVTAQGYTTVVVYSWTAAQEWLEGYLDIRLEMK